MTDFVTCHECGSPVPLVLAADTPRIGKEYAQVSNGLCIDLGGHYGGFNDAIGFAERWTILCHDCSVKLYETFPNATGKYDGFGLHPYSGEKCCRFGWNRS